MPSNHINHQEASSSSNMAEVNSKPCALDAVNLVTGEKIATKSNGSKESTKVKYFDNVLHVNKCYEYSRLSNHEEGMKEFVTVKGNLRRNLEYWEGELVLMKL